MFFYDGDDSARHGRGGEYFFLNFHYANIFRAFLRRYGKLKLKQRF